MDFKARKHLHETTEKLMKHEYKCLILLSVFIVWFISSPLWWIRVNLNTLDMVLYLLFLIVSPYLITGSRRLLIVSIVLGVLTIFAGFFFGHRHESPMLFLFYACILIFYDFSMTASLVIYTTFSKKFSRDLIFASIFTYFMIGMIFGDAYNILQEYDIVSFMPTPVLDRQDCIYYSFSTLTTVGYGDIVPASGMCKRLSSIESCLGVLYVAIFIGRLIAVYSPQKKENL